MRRETAVWVTLVATIQSEATVRAFTFAPLYPVIGVVVSVITRMAFHMDEVNTSLPALLFLSKKTIAQMADANILARFPDARGNILCVFRVVTDRERFIPTLSLSPEECVEHATEFPSIV